ncbi:hypothetical protein DFH94DRAFT_755265 [Russula ochroleuca]|uniref:Uncharacterized protein n=1 Tax=Russula ochroleuca TaxID=152965 RepID=A0A9P5MSG5_9AGAM|nr:hypothetical protein DFH94DRAFT_755265 [Russula ochroleuca]
MNSQREQSPRPLDKGKARQSVTYVDQEPTENSPLLASQSYVIHPDDDNLETASRSNYGGSLLSTLTTVFLITLSISILLVLLLLSLAYSYAAKASQLSNDVILNNGLVFRGPDAIDVLNISKHGDVWLRLDGCVGFDAGAIIGVKPDNDDNFWLDAWKVVGRWGIRNLDVVSLTLSSISISPEYNLSAQLASIEVPPLQIPLTAIPPDDTSWLTPISLPVHIRPSNNVSAWLHFARESWRRGYAVARATVTKADIQGGGLRHSTWRRAFRVDRSNVTVGLNMKIPVLPNLPNPGDDQPPPSISDLVHLARFSLSSHNHNLIVDAEATFVNPVPPIITLTSPPLPFVVWVPPQQNATDDSSIALASITAEPFTLTHPNITLSLHGNVLPLSPSAAPALSSLISDYLSGIDHPISITSPFALFSSYTAHTKFPAPHPRPEVLRNVTIEGMKIHASGTTILANGAVHARVAFPKGMDINLFINRILPDALHPYLPASLPLTRATSTANGMTDYHPDAAIDDDDNDMPPAPPLPSPLPPRAFARVRPGTWLPTMSAPTSPRRDWNEQGNTTLLVTAWFSDVPLEVLPGREREFRSFVAKVIFGPGEGAVAGVQGVAAVGVKVDGLLIGQEPDFHGVGDGDGGKAEGEDTNGTEMVLTGLPFEGSVRIGRKGMH